MDSLFYSCPNLTTFQTLKFALDETNTEYFTYNSNTILFGKPDVKWNQICFVFDNESPLIYTRGKIFGDLTNYTTHTELSNIIGNLGNKVEAKEAIYYTQEEANAYNKEHDLQEDDNDFITTNTIKIPATEAIPYTNIIELIQDNELAVASALTDINTRLSYTYTNSIDEQTLNNIYEIITYDELAVATSLTDLNSRFSYTENINNKVTYIDKNSTYDQYPSAKTMYDIISYNELAVASALNDLNDRLSNTYVNSIDEQTLNNIYEVITYDELAIATSLNDLNSRFSYTENINNKVSYLDENSTYDQYPSAKTMYDIIIDDELIIAYSLTNIDTRLLNTENIITDINTRLSYTYTNSIDEQTLNNIYEVITYDELAVATSLNDLNSRFSYTENINNKVSYLDENSTYIQYPSAKTMYDIITYNELAVATSLTDLNTRIANSEIIFNKVTYINNNSTDTQYPSAKAVYSYINEIFNLLNEEITYIKSKLIELEKSISGN